MNLLQLPVWSILLPISLSIASCSAGEVGAAPLSTGEQRESSIGARAASAKPPPADCEYDLAAKLKLEPSEFDHSPVTGWREVAARTSCFEAAAGLIQKYREERAPSHRLLFWHEGQMRAFADQPELAIPLFEKSRKEGDDPLGLNFYTDATIAFLRKDKAALDSARAKLAKVEWPGGTNMNLAVVDNLIACFGNGYEKAYSGCR